jgi:8-oxoguanine deaminase
MPTLLLRNIHTLATMDGLRREIRNAGIFIRDGWIEQVAETDQLPQTADEIVDLRGHMVLPGLINAHHHLFQTLDRACQCNAGFADWLRELYPRWRLLRPPIVQMAVEVGLTEMALSGCTTVADHNYLWPNGLTAKHLVDTARSVGLRFHLGHGFQNISDKDGGFAPDELAESDDVALRRCAQSVEEFHDPSRGSHLQVFVAPSSIRSVSADLLRRSADLARSLDVGFHMHLAETSGETDFTRAKFGLSPVEAAHSFGCLEGKSWIAHGVHLSDSDQRLLVQTGCGVCHCPSSNMRVGAGHAPIRAYRKAGVKVGLGVDGAASNDGANLLTEARLAMLLARIAPGEVPPLFSPRNALEVATLGSAALLRRDDIGAIEVGRAADLFSINLSRPELLGANDAIAAALLCAVNHVDNSWVHGRQIVKDRALVNGNSQNLVERVQDWKTEVDAALLL